MHALKSILQYSNACLIFLIISIIYSFILCNINYKTKYDLNDNIIEGILQEYYIVDNKLSFIIKGKERVKCIYYINNEKDLDYYSNLDLGIKIKLVGKLSEINNSKVFNTFDYKKYMKYKHVLVQMNVDKIIVINKDNNIFYKIKNILIDYINSFKSKSYLNAFILGDKSYINLDVNNNFFKYGISHLFAISGMHISILSMLILKLLYKLRDDYKYIIVIIFLLFYLFLTNFSASVVRSVCLFILLYINSKYYFNLDTIKVYYLTIGIILLIEPFFLYNIGFLYSSIISYALIRYSNIITGNYFIKCIKISLIALLFSLPITINTNYEINIFSVINNIFMVPFISFIMYPFSLFTFIFKPLDSIYFYLIKLLELIVNNLLCFNIIIPKLNIVFIILYYLLLYLFMNTYNKKILLIILLNFIIIKYSYLFDNNTYIYYLDVGQGDSILLKYKNDSILIDTGGKVSYLNNKKYYYSDNNIKFFKSIGISNIDYLILSHGDYDHAGECINLINKFKINNIIFNIDEYNNLEKDIIKNIKIKNIKYYKNINNIKFGKYKLYNLNTRLYDNENDNSNVLYLNIYNFKLLFMGDAGIEKEKDIINKYNIKNIDVLKVGHHGSDSSSSIDFINKVNPKYSIISVGKNNKYGHPSKSVLDILKNSKIYRTDIDGTIELILSKDKYKIKTYSMSD